MLTMWKSKELVDTLNASSLEKFEGFTEEEIKKVTNKKTYADEKKPPPTAVYKDNQNRNRHQNRLPRKNVARERLLKGQYNTFSTTECGKALPREARLHIPEIPEEEEEGIKIKNESTTCDKNLQPSVSVLSESKSFKENDFREIVNKDNNSPETVKINLESDSNSNLNNNNKIQSLNNSKKDKIMSCHTILNSEDADVDALEEFETRQKLMEEQNRQRKELLKKALADRAKKTHEEVKRLNDIEGELKKLDLLLSNDVAIIRNQIESASIDYMEAQKRYDKAEKEFLDAKLDFFHKKERKELLTNHLCTIIEQNELRKAKKLSDLMIQLEIGPKSSIITSQITVEHIPIVESVKQSTELKELNNKKEQKSENEVEDQS